MMVVLQPYGSLHFAGAQVLENQLPNPQGAQGATVILRLRNLTQSGSMLVSVLERYAKKLHRNGAHLVLTELNDRVYAQLTKTETIELIGVDRAYRAEADFLAATRRTACAITRVKALSPPSRATGALPPHRGASSGTLRSVPHVSASIVNGQPGGPTEAREQCVASRGRETAPYVTAPHALPKGPPSGRSGNEDGSTAPSLQAKMCALGVCSGTTEP